MQFHAGDYDVIVVGGGHAGCEAALSAAKLNKKVCLFTLSVDMIAALPCNPSIGGSSKGHLVREIDALGGEMGKVIDETYIQSKMLNVGKGPAVHSLRAQTDKKLYQEAMQKRLSNNQNIQIKQAEIADIIVDSGNVTGVICQAGAIYNAKSVILCTGTYLNARCLYGEVVTKTGPNGSPNSTKLTECLKKLDIPMFRFKTGTPARIDKRTIDFSKMEPQYGDEPVTPFSFTNKPEDIKREQIVCHLTYTNEKTHKIILDNLHRSPMHMGVIEGTGTRYCPSIEDKVVRFAGKERHQTFIEPEGLKTNEMYIQGISSALPLDVQYAFYRTIKGLEHCEIIRPAYAIEYDLIDATCLTVALMFKDIKGLFSAGQFNGSSGYEEAAAQGIVAGINASRYIDKLEPFILTRSDSYIGVLIDDLVTKGTKEPYRMMTARSEYRLLLRQDNADIRLTEKGYHIGLIDEERYNSFIEKTKRIAAERKRIANVIISPTDEVNTLLRQYGSTEIITGIRLQELVKRPELNYFSLESIDKERPNLPEDVKMQVDIETKYEGYILRQEKQVEQLTKMENKLLSENINYEKITGLRLEAIQKLSKIRPRSLGQASRITGVSPADISVLIIYLEQQKRKND